LRLGLAGYSKAYSWPGPAGRKTKAKSACAAERSGAAGRRFTAGNKRPRRRVPSGTTEAHDPGAIISSLRDLASLRIGVPALKRRAILARPFGTETLASTVRDKGC